MTPTTSHADKQPSDKELLAEALRQADELTAHADSLRERAARIDGCATEITNIVERLAEKLGIDPYEITDF